MGLTILKTAFALLLIHTGTFLPYVPVIGYLLIFWVIFDLTKHNGRLKLLYPANIFILVYSLLPYFIGADATETSVLYRIFFYSPLYFVSNVLYALSFFFIIAEILKAAKAKSLTFISSLVFVLTLIYLAIRLFVTFSEFYFSGLTGSLILGLGLAMLFVYILLPAALLVLAYQFKDKALN